MVMLLSCAGRWRCAAGDAACFLFALDVIANISPDTMSLTCLFVAERVPAPPRHAARDILVADDEVAAMTAQRTMLTALPPQRVYALTRHRYTDAFSVAAIDAIFRFCPAHRFTRVERMSPRSRFARCSAPVSHVFARLMRRASSANAAHHADTIILLPPACSPSLACLPPPCLIRHAMSPAARPARRSPVRSVTLENG